MIGEVVYPSVPSVSWWRSMPALISPLFLFLLESREIHVQRLTAVVGNIIRHAVLKWPFSNATCLFTLGTLKVPNRENT